MNMQEYINELKLHLSKLTDDDREDAISYYFEYLAEAGPDGAAAAMEKLGSPAELAAGIRADQAMQDFEDLDGAAGGAAVGKGVKAVWLAGLAAVPRGILAVFTTAIVIVVFFAVMIALFAAAVGIVAGGALSLISGVWAIHIDGSTALFFVGCGLALVASGILLFRFAIWASGHLLHTIATVFNSIRYKRDKVMSREREELINLKYEEKMIRKQQKRNYKYEKKLIRMQGKADRKQEKTKSEQIVIEPVQMDTDEEIKEEKES